MKWFLYECKGWKFVILMQMYITISIIMRKSGFLLDTQLSTWFIQKFASLIVSLNDYVEYGDKTGLQDISDKFYGSLNRTLI